MVIVSKRTTRREFLIQKKLHKILPKYIPEPLSYKNGIMKSRKYGVSLKVWLNTHKYTPQITKNVRLILKRIRRKYPGFRHMDLHVGNVLVCRGRLMIIDFGLSKMDGKSIPVNRDMSVFLKSLKRCLKKKPSSSQCSCQKIKSNESAASIAKKLLRLKA